MTDEEMADKYVIDTGNNDCTIEAFLAGLKAGRPKWHKVADGDLPNDNRTVFDEAGDRFYYFRGHFYYENDSIFDRQPIAWCDIPKYTEE